MRPQPNSQRPVKQPLTPALLTTAQLQEREDRQPVPWNHWIRTGKISGVRIA